MTTPAALFASAPGPLDRFCSDLNVVALNRRLQPIIPWDGTRVVFSLWEGRDESQWIHLGVYLLVSLPGSPGPQQRWHVNMDIQPGSLLSPVQAAAFAAAMSKAAEDGLAVMEVVEDQEHRDQGRGSVAPTTG